MVIDGDWGLLPVNRNSGYQTAKLGDKTVVWFHPIIQRLNSNFNGSNSGFILHVPRNINPNVFEMSGSIDQTRQWGYVMNSGFSLNTYNGVVKDDNWVKDNLYSFSVLYLAD